MRQVDFRQTRINYACFNFESNPSFGVFSAMQSSILKKTICTIITLAALAVLAGSDEWRAKEVNGGRGFTVGAYSIDNPASNRNHTQYPFAGRNRNQPWRYFMHGITDSNATPIAWNSLMSKDKSLKYLDASATINCPAKSSTLPAIKLEQGKSIEMETPIFDAKSLLDLRGSNIRFFIWIKGEATGQGKCLWEGAPSVIFTVYDKDGDRFERFTPLFHTRGTFPWFCYYMDIKIPSNVPLIATEKSDNETQDAVSQFALSFLNDKDEAEKHPAGLYVKLSNPASGTAWFSTLSYQIIDERNTLAATRNKSRLYDPVTGSLAPNPDYDELPMHIMYGLSEKLKWEFLKGTKTLPDITKTPQLEKYISTYYSDWAHSMYVIANLPSIKANATIFNTVGQFDDNWEDTLLTHITDAQELSGNGFWTVNNKPNLFLTAMIVSRVFSPVQPKRADRPEAEETPWNGLKGAKLRHADELINTLVAAQRINTSTKQVAGWNNFIFQDELENVPAQSSPCDFPATVAAATILYRAIPYASPSVAEKGKKALQQAWLYVMKNMLNSDLTWKNTAMRTQSTQSYDFYNFIENTPYLEFRTGSDLNELKLKPKFESSRVSFTWKLARPFVSLRIFVVPADTNPEQLDESNLTAIVQPKTYDIIGTDPLIAISRITNAANEAWGVLPADAGALYVNSKLINMPQGMKTITKDGTITIPYTNTVQKPMVVYVAAVNQYGEMTPYTRLEKPLPKPEPVAAPAAPEGGAMQPDMPPAPPAPAP